MNVREKPSTLWPQIHFAFALLPPQGHFPPLRFRSYSAKVSVGTQASCPNDFDNRKAPLGYRMLWLRCRLANERLNSG